MMLQTPDPLLPLEAAEQQAWRSLESLLRRTKGFVLLVYFVDTPLLALRLRDHLTDHLARQQQRLDLVAAERADGFAEHALHALFGGLEPGDVGAHWLEAHRGAGQEDWDSERRKLLLRLNERRGRLESEFRSALILLLPSSAAGLMAELAPDLWHVRVLSGSLRCDAGVAQVDLSKVLLPLRRSISVGQGAAATGADAEQALQEWRRQWRGVFGDVQAQHLAASHPGLASISLRDGHRAVHAALSQRNLEDARRVAEDLVALTRLGLAAAEPDRSDRARFELSSALDDLGHVAMAQSQWEQALSSFQESLDLARSLITPNRESPSGLRSVAVSLENLARAHVARQHWAAALESARESIRICRGLAEGTDLFGVRHRELAMALDLAGEIAFMADLLDEARTCFSESVELRRAMIQSWGGQLAKEGELLLALVGMVKVARQQQDWAAAQRFGRDCLDICRRQVERLPDSPEAAEDLAMALMANLDLPDTPTDAYRGEARRIVADLRRRFPTLQRYAELESALQSGDNPT